MNTTTRRTTWTLAIAIAAFGAGTQFERFVEPAYAAEELKPMLINLIDLKTDEISKPSATNSRSRQLGATDGFTVGVQEGATSKHYHAGAHEMQYVVSGTGSEWLNDKVVQLKPGDLLIIPKGTHHGGLTPGVRLLNFKNPPQVQGDSVPVK